MASSEIIEKVDPEALKRLDEYVALLAKWRRVTNLISDDGLAEIWDRHIPDAIYLYRQQPQAQFWMDFGSGAGLPGVVIAILLAGGADAQVHCVEIDRRKCAFLRAVATQLILPLKIHNLLAEKINLVDVGKIEVVTARAFSSVERILKVAHPFLIQGAVAILPRGRQYRDEVARLDPARYKVNSARNPSSSDGAFVRIELRDPHSL